MSRALDASTLTRQVLSSGLTVVLEPLPFVRSAAVGFSVRSGSSTEPKGLEGATHFLEHLLFKGTDSRSLGEIARQIDELGGEVDAYTGKEYTTFHAHVLDEQIDDAISLLGDLVTRPKYDQNDLEAERSVILEEINMVEDTPDDLIHEMFIEPFWTAHGLARPILGSVEQVQSLSLDRIQEHFRKTFSPENMIFAASGNIDPNQIIDSLETLFEDIQPDASTEIGTESNEPPAPTSHVTTQTKGELEQIHLVLGFRGVRQIDPDRYAAALFSTILGGGMSSRLFQRVREQEGLVYTVSSYHTAHLLAGYESIYAAASPDNVDQVIDVTLEELARIRSDGVTEDELGAAKRNVRGSIMLSLESTVSRMSGILRQEHYFREQYPPEEIIRRIDAVTLEDIQRVAEYIVDANSVSLAMIGPIGSVPSLESLRQRLGAPGL